MQLVDHYLTGATAKSPQQHQPKAEKLEEWKRLPLDNHVQLTEWHQTRDRRIVTSEVSYADCASPVFDPALQPSSETETTINRGRQMRGKSSTSTTSVLEQLRCCDAPTVPNAPKNLSDSGRWRENYF